MAAQEKLNVTSQISKHGTYQGWSMKRNKNMESFSDHLQLFDNIGPI